MLGARLAEVPFSAITHSPPPRAAETALIDGWGADELRDGPRLAEEALARLAVPAERETHELVITHSLLVGWFVRDALGGPPERSTWGTRR